MAIKFDFLWCFFFQVKVDPKRPSLAKIGQKEININEMYLKIINTHRFIDYFYLFLVMLRIPQVDGNTIWFTVTF